MAKKEVKPGAEATPPPKEQSIRVKDLLPKLMRFYLEPPEELIDSWTTVASANVEKVLFNWTQEKDLSNQRKGQPEAERTPMPPLLKPFEKIPNPIQLKIREEGMKAKETGQPISDNLYSPGSLLSQLWVEGWTAAKAPAPIISAAEQIKAKEDQKRIAEEDRIRRRDSTLRILHNKEMHARQDADSAERRWNDLKVQCKSAKAEFDAAISALRTAGHEIDALNEGTYERQKTIAEVVPAASKPTTSDVARTLPDTDTVDQPAIDAGAGHGLMALCKGPLQKATGCNEDLGLSKVQIEKLQAAVDGSTIGHLEKFQRENRDWNRSIPQFGEAAITKLQDAHSAFRRKFPQSDSPAKGGPVKPAEPAAKPAEKKGAETKPMDNAGALVALQAIVIKTGEVCATSDIQAATDFCGSVSQQAADMRKKLEESKQAPTVDQERAINNWTEAVDKWHGTSPAASDFGTGLDLTGSAFAEEPSEPKADDKKSEVK
jgi:hypothetical protein